MNRTVIIVIAAVLAGLGLASIFTVKETEYAIKFQLGRIVKADYAPGLHFKMPFVNNVRKFERVHQLRLERWYGPERVVARRERCEVRETAGEKYPGFRCASSRVRHLLSGRRTMARIHGGWLLGWLLWSRNLPPNIRARQCPRFFSLRQTLGLKPVPFGSHPFYRTST